MDILNQNVLPKIDSIKTKVDFNEAGSFIEKCIFIGFPPDTENQCFFDKNAAIKNGLYIAITTVVLGVQFEYYAVRKYNNAGGFPMEVSNEFFLEILRDTAEINRDFLLNWKNLYGFYKFPDIYKRG